MAEVLLAIENLAVRVALRAELAAGGHRVDELDDLAGLSLAVAAAEPSVIVVASAGRERNAVCALCAGARLTVVSPRPRVLVVVAGQDAALRIAALESGADDVVAEPFSVRELALRVRVLAERRRRPENTLVFGSLRVDIDGHRAFVGEREVSLSRLEFSLLRTLCLEPDRLFTRDALLDRVWGRESTPSSRVVDAYVSRLKLKLGPGGWYIRSVRGLGYRLDSFR